MAIVDGLIVCVQLHGAPSGVKEEERAGMRSGADSLTPVSKFSHPLKERLDCVGLFPRATGTQHLIRAQPLQCHAARRL